MSNPWDVPPLPAAGDPHQDTTYAAVGRALSHWEMFEAAFARIFAVIIGPGATPSAATRAYGSVLTFRGRADMVDAAMEVYMLRSSNAQLAEDFRKLLNETRQYAARRNEIAHGIVKPYVTTGANQSFYAGFVVFPSWYSTNKYDFVGHDSEQEWLRPRYAYSSVELNYFANQFVTLVPRAVTITATILSAKSVVPPPDEE